MVVGNGGGDGGEGGGNVGGENGGGEGGEWLAKGGSKGLMGLPFHSLLHACRKQRRRRRNK